MWGLVNNGNLRMESQSKNKHPAKSWTNRLFWRDLSDQDEKIQIIDLLHDIRFLLLIIFLILAFKS